MKVLVKAYAGSHLFGTNTPNSDVDYKGVYLPSKNDILLGKAPGSISIKRDKVHGEKNTKDDIDIEYYSLQKFMNMLYEGQTVALELLWTPDHLIIEKDSAWDVLCDFGRKEFIHKKVTSFVGYCKTQADKYGVKGSRMGTVKSVIDILNLINQDYAGNTKIGTDKIWAHLRCLRGTEHIDFGTQDTKLGPIDYMEICGRKFQRSVTISYALDTLSHIYQSYGARAKQAESNEGIDWKALSHAYRVCCQAVEILRDHKLTLPLKDEDLKIVRDVKLGLIPFNEFQPMLELKLEEVLKWEKESTLRADFDYTKWCELFVASIYEQYIKIS